MANPPVCRIMDYGKFRYEESQKAKESRKKTIHVSIKEVKFRPKIGKGDFDTKVRHMHEFLDEGHKVKVTLQFRGREMAHPELGSKILDAVLEQVGTARQGRDPGPAGRSQHDHGAGSREEGSRRRSRTNRRGRAARTARHGHASTPPKRRRPTSSTGTAADAESPTNSGTRPNPPERERSPDTGRATANHRSHRQGNQPCPR